MRKIVQMYFMKIHFETLQRYSSTFHTILQAFQSSLQNILSKDES